MEEGPWAKGGRQLWKWKDQATGFPSRKITTLLPALLCYSASHPSEGGLDLISLTSHYTSLLHNSWTIPHAPHLKSLFTLVPIPGMSFILSLSIKIPHSLHSFTVDVTPSSSWLLYHVACTCSVAFIRLCLLTYIFHMGIKLVPTSQDCYSEWDNTC